MILFNSIKPLKNLVSLKLDNNIKNKLTVHINNLKQDPKVKDYKTRFRWDLWWSLPSKDRDNIIAESIPRDNWIGGYPDINDNHINTLLKKCFDVKFLINVETGMIINKKGLFNA